LSARHEFVAFTLGTVVAMHASDTPFAGDVFEQLEPELQYRCVPQITPSGEAQAQSHDAGGTASALSS
jgi:hypothetical protein